MLFVAPSDTSRSMASGKGSDPLHRVHSRMSAVVCPRRGMTHHIPAPVHPDSPESSPHLPAEVPGVVQGRVCIPCGQTLGIHVPMPSSIHQEPETQYTQEAILIAVGDECRCWFPARPSPYPAAGWAAVGRGVNEGSPYWAGRRPEGSSSSSSTLALTLAEACEWPPWGSGSVLQQQAHGTARRYRRLPARGGWPPWHPRPGGLKL